jgi:hypothetical protein
MRSRRLLPSDVLTNANPPSVDRILAGSFWRGAPESDVRAAVLVLPKPAARHPQGGRLMAIPKSYRTYQDFEREEIRPSFKVGFSMEDLVEEATFEHDSFDWDKDPFDVDDDK